MPPTEHKDMGERLAAMETTLNNLDGWVRSLEPRVRNVESYVDKAKGGWWVLVTLSSCAGAVGGFIVKFFSGK